MLLDPTPRLRGMVLALVLLGLGGVAAELILLEHYEAGWQRAPLIAVVLALASLGLHGLRPSRRTVLGIRVAMSGLTLVGLWGVVQHFGGNRMFELEMDSALRGWELFWESLKGATPTLAPGMMAQLGLLGLVFTARHPRLNHTTSPEA
jgi:tellurite resistance protein TehA-like permease